MSSKTSRRVLTFHHLHDYSYFAKRSNRQIKIITSTTKSSSRGWKQKQNNHSIVFWNRHRMLQILFFLRGSKVGMPIGFLNLKVPLLQLSLPAITFKRLASIDKCLIENNCNCKSWFSNSFYEIFWVISLWGPRCQSVFLATFSEFRSFSTRGNRKSSSAWHEHISIK